MRMIVCAINVVVAVALSATCVAGAPTTREQTAVHHHCPDGAPVKMACCNSQIREADGLEALGHVQLTAPPTAPPIALLDMPAPAALFAGIVATPRSIPVKPPGTATYLAVSSLRI